MLVDRSAIGNTAMRGAFVLALCLSPIALPSAIEDRVDSCAGGVVSRLYLGQATPAGAVTELQWRAFVAESVTPRFTAGFTELQAQGHWRDGRGATIEDGTRIALPHYSDSGASADS